MEAFPAECIWMPEGYEVRAYSPASLRLQDSHLLLWGADSTCYGISTAVHYTEIEDVAVGDCDHLFHHRHVASECGKCLHISICGPGNKRQVFHCLLPVGGDEAAIVNAVNKRR